MTNSSANATEPAPDPILETLRKRHPGVSDGILFCVYKLEQNPKATLKDFQAEARLRGFALSGRSIHSARVLLGFEQPAPRRKKASVEVRSESRPRVGDSPSVEDVLRRTLRQIQEEAQVEAERLRGAIREALGVLQAALARK
jgi:hypothetical protein